MRVKLSLNKDLCIFLIYIFIFISAIAEMRFTLTNSYIWRIMYHFSVHAIITLSILFFFSLRIIKINALTALLGLMILFELITSYVNSLFVIPMIFVDILTWPFVLTVFFYYSKKNRIPDFIKPITFIGVTLICIIAVPNIIGKNTNGNGGAVFTSYYCLTFLPLLYMVCANKIATFYSVFVLLLMLFSSKRAGFLAAFVGMVGYYFLLDNRIITKNRIREILKVFLLLLIITFIGKYITYVFDLNVIDRIMYATEDQGSGRLKIWAQVIDTFNVSSQFTKWFGHGFHAVFYQLQPFGISRFAHNSFVETLYDYGYIGLSFLILFIVQLLHAFAQMIKLKYRFAPVMGYSIIIMSILSSVSYFFEQAILVLPLSAVWGMVLGIFSEEKRSKIFERSQSES